MSVRRRSLAALAAIATLAVGVTNAQNAECCSSCIGKTALTVYDYDPLSYEQCTLKPTGPRICCFECGTLGEPTYGDSVGFGSDGTTPTIKTGKWVSMQWSTVNKVTFITLKDGQKKTVTPTLNDTAATVTDGYYMICARSKGSIVFRGWGTDTCRQASPEKTIEVLEGEAGATCESAAPTAPTETKSPSSSTSSSQSDDPNLKNCNLNRASIKEVDGRQQCVCVNEWSGAPACDQMPTWKWIITIGGGIAALFSILISVHAFIKSRKKKQKEEEEDDIPTPAAKDDVEILRIGADRPSANANQNAYTQHNTYQLDQKPMGYGQQQQPAYNQLQQPAYGQQQQQQPAYGQQQQQGGSKRGYDDDHGVYKMNDREFSL